MEAKAVTVRILSGDCREVLPTLPDRSVNCCVTSPPYFGLRDYGHAGQIGLESAPEAFVSELVAVFREVRRVLRDDGTLWLNMGDSYGTGASGQNFDPASGATNAGGQGAEGSFGHRKQKPVRGFHKQLLGIPWRVAFALHADGWYLRQDIIWHKPNPMPESVRDRCTKAHEYIFLLAKSERYYYDADAIAEPALWPDGSGDMTGSKYVKESAGDPRHRTKSNLPNIGARETRNKRSVWTVTTKAFKDAHFATFPPDLIEPCILAGCPVGGTVLDPFGGAGTTGLVADRLQRNAVLIELNPAYADMARERITGDAPMFASVTA
jgi:DNA modification methylase